MWPALSSKLDSPDLGQRIHLQNTSILAKKSRCIDKIIREATEIILHGFMNREAGVSQSKSWKSLICSLKEWKQAFIKDIVPISLRPFSDCGPYKDLP
jgi:hypothetical protein